MGLTWIGCMLFTVAFHYFLMLPRQRAIKITNAGITAKQDEQGVLQDAKDPATRDKLIRQLQQRKNIVAGYLADCYDSAELTFAIQALVDPNEINTFTTTHLGNENPPETRNCQYVLEQRINADFSTSFTGFLKFVNALERAHPLVFVDSFIVERDIDKPGLNVGMELAIFIKNRQQREITARAH